MDACLSHDAALRWLLGNPNPLATGQGHPCAGGLPARAPSDEEAAELMRLSGIKAPLETLVSAKGGMRSSRMVRCHLERHTLLPGSLIRMDGFIVCSPEYAFLQAATTGDLIDAVATGYALCSAYRLDARARGGISVRKPPDMPLTSIQRLSDYLKASDGVKGIVRARRALRYVAENSFSPMESGIAMCLSLPLNLGGRALGSVELNPELRVRVGTDQHGKRLYETRRPDLLMTYTPRGGVRRQVAIDVDSAATHSSARDLARDAARRNELQSSHDIPHLSITGSQATDFVTFSRFIDLVRLSLGQRRKDFSRGSSQQDLERLERVRHRQFELWMRCVSASAKTVGR